MTQPAPDSEMKVCILGPVTASRRGSDLLLGGSKPRSLLAALLLARGRLIPGTRLSELLWGLDPPATVSAQIYTYVSRLRKILLPDIDIVRQSPGYFLRAGSAEFDYDTFERLASAGQEHMRAGRFEGAAESFRSALSLWQGPPLANVTEFLTASEGPRLDEARMAALESRIEAELALGRHRPLVPELTELVTRHPLRERLRAQLMTALYRCDRQADALGAFHEGRHVLADELGVDPGALLVATYEAVLRGEVRPSPVAEPEPRPQVRFWGDVTPAMLPPATARFAGRASALADMVSQLRAPGDGERQTRVLVVGPGGVGKSALALHTAHACREDFPDGQLYADLGGPGGAARDAFDVLEVFLPSLGMPGPAMPDTMEGRLQLYRSLLASRRVLVVLDNAASDSQVRPLLPSGPRCGVVVTSRGYLAAAEASHVVRLEVLGADEAYRLLSETVGVARVGREPGAAAQIVALCDRLPLAVVIAGSRLAAKPRMSLGQFAQRLADERCRLHELRFAAMDVRGSLRLDYECLDPRAKAAVRRLALLGMDSFPGWAIPGLLGMPAATADEVMEAIADTGLLDVSAADGDGVRYRWRSLVRLFARECAEAEETAADREAMLDNAIAVWLEVARQADWAAALDALLPAAGRGYRGGLMSDPLAWFEAEEEALLTLYHQACATGRNREAWMLSEIVTRFLAITMSTPWRPTTARLALRQVTPWPPADGQSVTAL